MSEVERTPEEIEAEIAALQAEEAALKAAEVAPEPEVAPALEVKHEEKHAPGRRVIIHPAGQTVPAAAPLQPLAR